ncbi:BLUF domain-containing protein [Brevundimonas sp.]|uniref:BLUF domain-containing protein n=1 Tax=Brevundimonas sp. TaxID=1871086 RepID=UPI002ABC2DCC|nr:BLUF domain-containing protein [Brevundimonas sp.]MDZ4363424.1 BLUF domain-containing protein [Brevundimonas sp.]
MLYRVIYAAEALGATGTSVLSLAQILGVSERNNARDEITSRMLIHAGQVLQAAEGQRGDLDRLQKRLMADPRLGDLRILSDRPIISRSFTETMGLRRLSRGVADAVLAGRPLWELSPSQAEALLDDSSQPLSAVA